MTGFRLLHNSSGAIPIVLIWVIVIAVVAGAAGFLGYFAANWLATLLVITAVAVIFILIVLPNSKEIVRWTKGVIHEIKNKK